MMGDLALQREVKRQGLWRKESVCLTCSTGLGWEGISIGRHIVEPGEKSDASTTHFIVELSSGQRPFYGGRHVARGRFIPCTKRPGDMTLHAEGILPRLQVFTRAEVIVCALDPGYVAKIAAEQDESIKIAPRDMKGRDDSVASLITLLEQEARLGGPSGRLYSDHLSHALALRLLTMESKSIDQANVPSNALSQPRLRRVLDKMQADLSTDTDLQTLATESGYSRSHFLRMFRAATGRTPHQYLLDVRVGKAQEMIKEGSASLIEIALACGFSSHSHLSRIFRQAIGVTPSEFRRDVS